MKKGLAFALVALLSACFVFAEGSYVVKSVKGKVQEVELNYTSSLKSITNSMTVSEEKEPTTNTLELTLM